MDLMAIAQRTGIAPRQLRYAIYHTLMPGVSQVHVGKGSLRSFTEFEAFGIALAAMLLDAGLKRDLVSECIKVLSRQYGRNTALSEIPLYRAYSSRGKVHLDIGDRIYVRSRADQNTDGKSLDAGWQRVDARIMAPTNYEPVVLLSLNVTRLRDALKSSANA